jgi:electron transfer flavoprotein beta subunit
MKIIVCLKQVPKNDSILRINDQQSWIQDRDLSYEINESDAYALEEALQLKEKHGGEVIALSLGPARVSRLSRRGWLAAPIEDYILKIPSSTASTHSGTASAIAAAANAEGFDLLLTVCSRMTSVMRRRVSSPQSSLA